jgi:hypothetical protein
MNPGKIGEDIKDWHDYFMGLPIFAKFGTLIGISVCIVIISLPYLPDLPFFLIKSGKVEFSETGIKFFNSMAAIYLLSLFLLTIKDKKKSDVKKTPGETDPSDVLSKTPEHLSLKHCFSVYSPKEFAEQLTKIPLNQWASRASYIGVDGGKLWLDISRNPHYATDERDLLDAIEKMLNGDLGISRIVSFGPGDAKSDSIMLNYLNSLSKNRISYIPVDISEYIILSAIKQISELHEVANIPFGILGDFESNLQSINEILNSDSQNGKTLFVMLGNTISNLDKGPETFYKQVNTFMKKGDYFLFDILTGNYDERMALLHKSDLREKCPDTPCY